MSKTLFLLVAFIHVYFVASTQKPANPNPGNSDTDKELAAVFNALHVAREDSNKVKLLLSLCTYHWKNRRNPTNKDSLTRYAKEARKLSKTVHFTSGFNEASFMLGRSYLFGHEVSKAINLLNEAPKDEQSRFLISIGEYYLFLPGQERKNLDSASYYFTDALKTAQLMGQEKWKHESLIALGKYYFSDGQFSKAKNCFLQIIDDFQRSGNRSAALLRVR